MPGRRRGARWLTACAGATTASLLLAACSSPPPDASAGRSRSYSAFQACLLTGSGGVSDAVAALVWAGMEDASAATHAKVSYLAVMGPQTEANASTFVGSLVARQCGVILAAGQAEMAAVAADAGRFASVRFAIVAASEGPFASNAPNLAVVTGNQAQLRSGVASFVAKAAGG